MATTGLPNSHSHDKNPNWTREEAILALAAHFSIKAGSDKTSTVRQLSRDLGRLPIHSLGTRAANFRNEDGTRIRIDHFDHMGEPQRGSGQIFHEVWTEFGARPQDLVAEAAAIRFKYRGQLIESPDQVEPPAAGPDAPSTPAAPRVWVTSFWGFDPEKDGYLGFTAEGDRDRFLREYQEHDLVLIYATRGKNTPEALRGKILGILDVDPRPVRDNERMSDVAKAWKRDRGLTEKWTYAVPVRRAWRTVVPRDIRAIAPRTLRKDANAELIGRRGELLDEQEACAALSLEYRRAEVYGMPPVAEEEKAKIYVPSNAFPLSFGKREIETTDGIHYLYALQLVGNTSSLMGWALQDVVGKIIIKIGYAKDPKLRLRQHNKCLPPAALVKWRLLLQSAALCSGEAAQEAERALKARFAETYRSLGGEFYLCEEKTVRVEFSRFAVAG